MDKPALEALLGSLDGWAAFFTLLVVAGVGGEFAVHIMSSRASKRLVDIQRQEEQARQAEIARITKDAESFRAESAKAQSDIAATSVRISDAEARVAEATARAAEANKKAEEERLERVKIQEKLAPRHLSAEQRQGIAVRLRPFAGTKINVFAYGGDQESGVPGGHLPSSTDKRWVELCPAS